MSTYLQDLQKRLQGGDQRRARGHKAIASALEIYKAQEAQKTLVVPQAANPSKHTAGDGHDHAGGKGLDPEFDAALQRFIRDAPGGGISLGSGYRSFDEQAKLYDRWLKKVPGQAKAAPPGKSNHNYGEAGDLKYATPEAKAWAHANAAKYGLRFPMSYEPWHIEPITVKRKRK